MVHLPRFRGQFGSIGRAVAEELGSAHVASNTSMMAGVAGRYASALLETANEQGQLAAIEADIKTIETALDESADLTRMVRSPVFSADDQANALDGVLGKMGVNALTLNFFKLLARNRRLFAAGDIIRAFKAMAADARGEVQAEVTSAVALSDGQLDALKQQLKDSVGKDVQLEANVDPALLGGLVVRIGSRMIDSSLKTKLATLNTRMKEVG
jgi:F-type H+-transporting ATPase subunit delta